MLGKELVGRGMVGKGMVGLEEEEDKGGGLVSVGLVVVGLVGEGLVGGGMVGVVVAGETRRGVWNLWVEQPGQTPSPLALPLWGRYFSFLIENYHKGNIKIEYKVVI